MRRLSTGGFGSSGMVGSLFLRVTVLTFVLGFCVPPWKVAPYKNTSGRHDDTDSLYKNGIMAVRNFFDTKNAIQDRKELLSDEEKRIKAEKEKVELVDKSFNSMFPSGTRKENQARDFMRYLRELDDRETQFSQKNSDKNESSVIKKQNNSFWKIVVAGGLLTLAGIGLGLIIGKSRGSSSSNDGQFAEFLAGYIKGKE